MADSKTAINEAKQRLRRGDKAGAARVLQSLIDAEPDNTHALVLLGILRERTGNAPAAEQYLSRVLASNSLPVSQRAEVLMHLGRVLNRLERRDEALTALAEAAQLQPDSVRPLRGLADALHGAHRAGEALEIYEKALTLDAADWRTLNNLALALLTLDRPVDAERQLRAAVNAAPSEATCLNNLGEALLRQFKACEAVEVYDRARSMEPANPMALLGHARALAAAGQLPEAEEAASKLPPGLPFPGAETAYVSWQLQRFAACDWEDYDATLMRIRELTMTALDQATSAKAPDTARVPALKPLAALECYPEDTPLCNAIARAWSVATRDHVGHGETPQLPDTNGRIRIGYASPDFRVHPVAFLMRDLFAHHDKDRFEVFAYALRAPDDSGLVRSIREAADHFVDLSGDDDATAAERIRADRLHVLIDAAGYTAEARPAILAARPAPIQVSYLGFFGSQQADWIDYLVANDTLVPASREKNYSETMVRIEPTPFAIDGFGDAPTGMTRSQAGLPDDAVVLCCFHRSGKLNPTVFDCWMQILNHAPRAVLWLRADTVLQQENLNARVRDSGIKTDRVIFAAHVRFDEHVARHRLADLALDVPGFGGFNTNAIALWCGVPLLTTPAAGYASRVGTAVMRACNMADAVAKDMDDYVKRAVAWCTDPDELGKLKAAATRARDSALFDGAGTTARVEKAWSEIVKRAAAGQPPSSVTVKG